MTGLIAYRVTDDGSLIPEPRFRKQFAETFACQEIVILERHEERSGLSRRHLFAFIADAWATLPEHFEGRFASPEHLRKWLLIKAGYCDHRQHVCGTRSEAQRLRAAISPMDAYAIVTLTGCIVDVYTAQSMSSRAMDKRRFQQAKTDILEQLAILLEADRGDTERNARAA